MTTVDVVRVTARPTATERSANLDGDVRRVGDDVVHRRSLLRLSDERLDLIRRGVGVDVVRHLDAAEPVADITVDPEDPGDVHVAFERRRHRTQLDLAILGHGRHTSGEAAGESHKYV